MEAAPSSVNLVDSQRLLSLFAQGISGRTFHLKPLAALATEFRLRTPTPGDPTLFLPDVVDEFPERRQNLGFYKVAVMHQLGFYEFESWAFDLSEARRRVPGLASCEVQASRARPGELEPFFACFPERALVRRLFGVLEDHRVDCELARGYPGLRRDLGRAIGLALARRGALPSIEGAAGLLEALVRCTLRADARELRTADRTGLVDGVIDAARRVGEPRADVYTSAAQAIRCLELLRTVGIAEALGAATLDEIASFVDRVEFRGNAPPDFAQMRLRIDAKRNALERAGEAGAVIAPEWLERVAADAVGDASVDERLDARPRRIGSERGLRRRALDGAGRAERSFLYDEWDCHGRVYLRGWCRLTEERLVGGDGLAFLESVHHRHAALLSRVRRQFQHIKPESTARVRKVSDGDEIDLDRAVEARSDIRAGLVPSERVYTRRERARREVAAAFLVDLSASVREPVPDPDGEPEKPHAPDTEHRPIWGIPPVLAERENDRRRVIDIQKEALALMVQALEALGDEYGIYGFSGENRENVAFYVAKELGDRLGLQVWNAIAAMRSHRYTRMGTAIRHTIRKLERRDARRKVMLLISDGYPQDIDYGPDRDDREYGIHDTAKALREAELARIETFCVTIDRAGHDYLREMCPEGRYLIIDEVESLPVELGKVYRLLTRRWLSRPSARGHCFRRGGGPGDPTSSGSRGNA
jgi:nitric oxide reductase NorD protein